MTLPVPSGSKPLPCGSPTTLITSLRPLLLLGRAIPGARQLSRGSPTTTTLITTLKTLLLLGIAATLSPTSEAMDHLLQVMPRVLVLTKKAPVGKVVVTCRQLPSSPPSNHPVSLTLLRQAKEGDGHADTLADVSEGGLVVYKLDKGDSKFYTATGQRDTYLQLVMSRASCHESTYNYICKSRLLRSNQTSVSLFAAMAELPRPILKARSTQEVYTDSQHLTLTCEINSPIGLVTDHAQGQWVWEYNDVGPWKPAERSDISTLQATTEGCFQSSGFTRIKVRVKDLAHCWRLFRCYTRTPVSRAADNAAEFMVSRGIDCEKSSIQGAKPAVAILTVLLVITFLTALVTYLFRTSSRLRITFKEEEKQSMGTMLLSPMSDQQRNRLVEEQMHQHHVSTTPATYGVLKRTVPTSSDRLDDKASFEVAMRKMSSPLPLKSFLKTSPARTTSPANNTDSMQPLLATEDSSFSTSVFDSSTYVSSYESETTSEAPSEATSEATSDAQP